MKLLNINQTFQFKPARSPKSFKWLRLLLLILIGVLLIEAGWLLVTDLSNKTVIANWSTIEKGCWVDVLFLRKETVIRANQDGYFYCRHQNGTMVPKSDIVGYLTADQGKKYSESDLVKYKVQNSLLNEKNRLEYHLQQVVSRLNELNSGKEVSRKQLLTKSDLPQLKAEQESILADLDRINRQLTESDIVDLEDGLLELITATESGFLTLEYDGYESKLQPDDFQKLKFNDFLPKYQLQKVAVGSRVKSGAIVGKIVDPFHQIVAVVVDPRQTGIPKKAEQWEIKIKNNWRKISIIDIITLSSDKMIVGFNLQELEPEFSANRYRKLFLIYRRIAGVSVPVQAVYRKKGQYFVKVAKGNSFFEREINLLESDGQNAIIEGINVGTAVKSR